MSTGIYNIGITGMNAAQLGLMVTEHNISNATTPGFNRQRTIQSTNNPIMTGAGAIGQGTKVNTVERMYDEFLVTQVNRSQTNVSELETYYTEISQIDNMLADINSGLSPALQDFFTGVQQVASTPASMPARQSMVSTAQSMVARFQGLDSRLTEIADGVNGQITNVVENINTYAQNIADLNQRIVLAQAASQQPPNDLMDQRDQLVSELNKLVRVNTTVDSDGSYNVFIGTGQQLVVGTQLQRMTAVASSADPTRMVIALVNGNGQGQQMPESLITGGQLGGLLRFRAESLDTAFNQLGRVATTMALTFNAQHALGQDLLGQAAGQGNFQANFFNISGPVAIPNATNLGTATASATFVTPPPINGHYNLQNNAGTYVLTRLSDGTQWSAATPVALQALLPANEGIDVSAANLGAGASTRLVNSTAQNSNFYTKLSSSDYQLSFDATGAYTVTRLTDGQTWSTPAAATPAQLATLTATVANSEGFTLTVSAGMAAGDSFLIQPTRQIARNISVNATIANDPRLIAAAMPIRGVATASNTGNAKIVDVRTLAGYAPAATTLPFTLTYSAGAGTLSGFPAAANVSVTVGGATTVYTGGTIPYTPATGAKIAINGIAFEISGTPGNTDTFTISFNTGGVSDGRNILTLGKLQSQKTVASGTASYQDAYAQLVSDNGNRTKRTDVTAKAQNALLNQATSAREALSGVNLDEEAAHLIRFQQAYQASAKMLEIGSKLFDSLLALR